MKWGNSASVPCGVEGARAPRKHNLIHFKNLGFLFHITTIWDPGIKTTSVNSLYGVWPSGEGGGPSRG